MVYLDRNKNIDKHSVGQLLTTTSLVYLLKIVPSSPFRLRGVKRCHFRKCNGLCMFKFLENFKANAVIDFLMSTFNAIKSIIPLLFTN